MEGGAETLVAENIESQVQQLEDFFSGMANRVLANSESINHEDLNLVKENMQAFYLLKAPKQKPELEHQLKPELKQVSITILRPVIRSIQKLVSTISKVGTMNNKELAKMLILLPNIHETSDQAGDGINHGGQGGW